MTGWTIKLVVVAVACALVVLAASAVARWFRRRETGVAVGPLFIVSGAIVLAVCALWSFANLFLTAPLGAHIAGGLLDSGAETVVQMIQNSFASGLLDEPLKIPDIGPIPLPASIALPLGILTAGVFYVGIVMSFGGTLAELHRLERAPPELERKEAERLAKAAKAAGRKVPEPPPEPLTDDGFGKVFRMVGYWSNVATIEPRFISWHKPLLVALTIVLFISVFATLLGKGAIPFWIGAALAFEALRRNLNPVVPRDRAKKKKKKSKSDKEQNTADEAHQDDQPDEAGEARGEDEASAAERVRKALLRKLSQRGPVEPAPAGPLAAGALTATAALPPNKVFDDVQRELEVPTLYAHQAEALTSLAKQHVLVTTPRGSGRQVLMDLVALYRLLGDASRVLYVATNAEAATDAAEAFRGRATKAHWNWNILDADLLNPDSVDLHKAQPVIVFTDPERLHRQIVGDDDSWRIFLNGLALVVIPDIHTRFGVVGAHLAHLLRRLRRAVRRAGAVSLGTLLKPRDDDEALRFLCSAEPAYRDLAGFAHRVAGVPFKVVRTQDDGAPIPEQHRYVMPPLQDHEAEETHPAIWARDVARGQQLTAAIVGYEDSLTKGELGDQDPAEAEVIIVRAPAGRYATLPTLGAHLGWNAPKPEVIVLWQPESDPFSRLLAAERPEANDPMLRRGCRLVVSTDAGTVERTQLLCTLAEDEISVTELSHLFAKDVLDATLATLREEKRLRERTREVLDVANGRLLKVQTVTMAGAQNLHAEAILTVAGPAMALVEHFGNKTLAHVERARALAFAYPGRIFVQQGQRYEVLPFDRQDQLEHGRVLCQGADEALITTPMREITLEPVERRDPKQPEKRVNDAERRVNGAERTDGDDERRVHDTERRVRGERRATGLSKFGRKGAEFTLEHRDARITEQVVGLRRFGPDGRDRDSSEYDEPIVCTYDGRVALMGFVAADVADRDLEGGLHALAHLFRTVLPAFLRHTDADLIVTDLMLESEGKKVPTIAFIDVHAGGAGFADAIDKETLRHVVHWSLAIVSRCPQECGSPTGCTSCIQISNCHSSPDRYGVLEKDWARDALAALLPAE